MSNTTSQEAAFYNTAHLIVIPLIPAIICPIISLVVYIAARRRLNVDSELKSKAFIFYRMISGTLFGEFIARINFLCTPWLAAFIAIGYTIFDVSETIARVWNTNPNYIAPDDDKHEDIGLDRKKMEKDTVMVSDDIGSDDFAIEVSRVEDSYKFEVKRQWILGTLIGIFSVLSLTDGILLIYNNPRNLKDFGLMLLAYFMTCSALSTCVYGGMIHAKLHVMEETKYRLGWWIGITGAWCTILFCCTIPLLSGMSLITAHSIIENQALLAFFGIAVGIMLKIQVYFHAMKIDQIDKSDLFWGSFVFTFSIVQAIVSGFFL